MSKSEDDAWIEELFPKMRDEFHKNVQTARLQCKPPKRKPRFLRELLIDFLWLSFIFAIIISCAIFFPLRP